MEFTRELQNIQLGHLQAQQKHLSLVRSYHLWMMNEASNSNVRDFHHTIADNIGDALQNLDRLIETIQPISSSVINEHLTNDASEDLNQ